MAQTKKEGYLKWLNSGNNRELKNAKKREWTRFNADKVKADKAAYRSNPVVKVYEQYMKKLWVEKNPEKWNVITKRRYAKIVESGYKQSYDKQYRENPINKLNRNKYAKERGLNNPHYRAVVNLRARMRCCLLSRDIRKSKHSLTRLVGCDREFFKNYIASMFTKGMSWDNYGEWHLDHIKPLALFDLTVDEEIKKAGHYTNLHPLWALDNMKKGFKYNEIT